MANGINGKAKIALIGLCLVAFLAVIGWTVRVSLASGVIQNQVSSIAKSVDDNEASVELDVKPRLRNVELDQRQFQTTQAQMVKDVGEIRIDVKTILRAQHSHHE